MMLENIDLFPTTLKKFVKTFMLGLYKDFFSAKLKNFCRMKGLLSIVMERERMILKEFFSAKFKSFDRMKIFLSIVMG